MSDRPVLDRDSVVIVGADTTAPATASDSLTTNGKLLFGILAILGGYFAYKAFGEGGTSTYDKPRHV